MKKELGKVLDFLSKYQRIMNKNLEETAEKNPLRREQIRHIKNDINKKVREIIIGLHELGMVDVYQLALPNPYGVPKIKKEVKK